jgi:hypothetical protein
MAHVWLEMTCYFMPHNLGWHSYMSVACRYAQQLTQPAFTMASTAVHGPSGHQTSFEPLDVKVQTTTVIQPVKPHHVNTSLNYYKAAEDGSPPHPSYVGKPETYERPSEPLEVTVHDIRGQEHEYTLDKNGFQIYPHESKEKDFLDDEQIKAVYYPETEQLLKDV